MNSEIKLKYKAETFFTVEYYDLEEFIKKITGHSIEIVSMQEWSNDSQHRLHVDAKLDEWTQIDWDSFKEDGYSKNYILQSILDGLCKENKITAGTYIINVTW